MWKILGLLAIALASTGCSTTQNVTLAKQNLTNSITTVAQVAADGNSVQMDTNLTAALVKEGLVVRGKLPAGTTTTKDVDALVSYVDIWRWDIVMYLRKLTIQVSDATTGDLIALGEWTESPFHQFRGEGGVKAVVEQLVSDVMTRIRSVTKPAK